MSVTSLTETSAQVTWTVDEPATVVIGVAMTDGKGDRSLRPHQQANADTYVHISERRPDGIVIRGRSERPVYLWIQGGEMPLEEIQTMSGDFLQPIRIEAVMSGGDR